MGRYNTLNALGQIAVDGMRVRTQQFAFSISTTRSVGGPAHPAQQMHMRMHCTSQITWQKIPHSLARGASKAVTPHQARDEGVAEGGLKGRLVCQRQQHDRKVARRQPPEQRLPLRPAKIGTTPEQAQPGCLNNVCRAALVPPCRNCAFHIRTPCVALHTCMPSNKQALMKVINPGNMLKLSCVQQVGDVVYQGRQNHSELHA